MARYVVDLCRTSAYTDSNGVSWWGEHFRGMPDVLKLYKPLEGRETNGIFVEKVFEFCGIVKAHVLTEQKGIDGLFLSPRIKGEMDESKNITSVDYTATTLDSVPVTETYAVEGLKGFRLVGEL